MKKGFFKLLSLFISFIMFTMLSPGQTAKAATTPDGMFTYTVSDGNATITGLANSAYSGPITLPSNVSDGTNTFSVTSIGNSAFKYSSGLSGSLTIPDSVTSIGDSAFWGCSGLTGLTIGNSVTSIGNSAFWDCTGLMGTLTIPDSVTTIGSSAFWDCARLTGLSLGKNLNTISYAAFRFCSSLNTITAKPINAPTTLDWTVFDGVPFTAVLTTPNTPSSNTSYDVDPWSRFVKGAVKPDGYEVIFDSVGGSEVASQTVSHDSCVTEPTAPIRIGYLFGGWFIDPGFNTSFDFNTPITADLILYAKWGPDPNEMFTYSIILGNATIMGLADPAFSGPITIPSTVSDGANTYPVTSIGKNAFLNCSSLTGDLTIPNTVTTIGARAFSGCSGLTGLTIGNGVTRIIDFAFMNCSGLTGDLTIPDTVTSIGASAFSGCSGLTGLTIGNGVTSIGNSAFDGCSGLAGLLTIPDSVTSIGDGAFASCSSLTGTLTIPDSVTSIGDSAFWGCSGLTGLTIGNSVTSIGNSAFWDCTGLMGTLTIPDSVTTIGSSAFWDCAQLTGLSLGKNLNTISYAAFRLCSSLNTITAKPINAPTTLDWTVFDGVPFTAVLTTPNTPSSNTTYDVDPWSRFVRGAVKPDGYEVVIFDSVGGSEVASQTVSHDSCVTEPTAPIRIGYLFGGWFIDPGFNTSFDFNTPITADLVLYAKWNPDLNGMFTYTISGGNATITGLADPAYSGPIALPSQVSDGTSSYQVTIIGDWAFADCYGLSGLTIENGVTSIGESAFEGCSHLTGPLTIPDTVTNIGASAFEGCSLLTGPLTIPDSVTSIGDRAFSYCEGLSDFNVSSYNPTYSSINGILYDKAQRKLIQCPVGKVGQITIPDSVTSIGDLSFNGCSVLTGLLTIPDSVTSIGDQAFYGCSGLTGLLTIPDSVTNIGYYAFSYCSGLTGLTIGNGVTSIGHGAFRYCSGLTALTLGNVVNLIGHRAFVIDSLNKPCVFI